MKERLLKVCIYNIVIILVFIIYYFIYKYFKIGIPCMFHELTGLRCPGCGITRMLFSIIQLDFYKAYKYNQLLFSLLPVFGLYVLCAEYLYISKNKYIKVNNIIIYILIIIMILFGVLRNIYKF